MYMIQFSVYSTAYVTCNTVVWKFNITMYVCSYKAFIKQLLNYIATMYSTEYLKYFFLYALLFFGSWVVTYYIERSVN